MKHSAQIALFLQQMKEFVQSNGLLLVERSASKAFMASYGMTLADVIELVLSLETQDCIDGPEPDRDPRFCEHWTVAEFAPLYNTEKLYVKLSIRMDVERCKCLSIKLWTDAKEDENRG